MTHDNHDTLPGYTPGQLLHAGCGECEARARQPGGGIAHLDRVRFARAWGRAALWQAGGGALPDLDAAEMPMLGALWAVQTQLERFGVPVGHLPIAVFTPAPDPEKALGQAPWIDTLWIHLLSKHGPIRAVQWGLEDSQRWHQIDHDNEADAQAESADYVPHDPGDLSYDVALARKVLARYLDARDPLPPEYAVFAPETSAEEMRAALARLDPAEVTAAVGHASMVTAPHVDRWSRRLWAASQDGRMIINLAGEIQAVAGEMRAAAGLPEELGSTDGT
jgi:hypothetical protein